MPEQNKATPGSGFFSIALGVGVYAWFAYRYSINPSIDPVWRWLAIFFGTGWIWQGIVTLLRCGGGWIAWGVVGILTVGLGSATLVAFAVVSYFGSKAGAEPDAQSGSAAQAQPPAVATPQRPATPSPTTMSVVPDPATGANAGFRICNQASERTALALGYRQGEAWVSEGWRPLERGACLTVANRIAGNRYYFFAMGERGGTWGGEHALCIDTQQGAFRIEGAGDCEARGHQSSGFGMREFATDTHDFTLDLTGGRPDPLDELEEDDGVYVQGWLADEMVFVVRVDKINRRVKVRRSEDLTTAWVGADKIISREQAQLNEVGRISVAFCLIFGCDDQNQQTPR